jgi:hypothetical protein
MSTQIGNKAGADMAGRDVNKPITNIYASPKTAMSALIEQYKREIIASPELSAIIAKLEHFLSNETSSDMRDLNEKLEVSGRQDLILDALSRKQSAYKLIMRYQQLKSAQMILAFILAELVVRFDQNVRPIVQSGGDRTSVDTAILEGVLTPTFLALEENPLGIDLLDLQSLLYFLGGNCHIRWDAC